ncbi:sensor histidine kinase [Bacillus massilinigeriensis]|uniref:sensor histidine kinase n=1 Tax=Bacillus massilionigeriensis TaxID=1805475 RepID=UPI00096AE194|nr:histidine kinase [Bacillus massilionigeriensis]
MKKERILKIKLRPFSVKAKLIAYTMLILLPVIIFCLIYQHEAERILKEKAGKQIVETVGLSTLWLDEVISGAVRISAAAGSDRLINQYILNQQGNLPEYEDIIYTREASERLMEILNTETRVSSIWIYLPDQGKVLSTEYGYYEVPNKQALQWMNENALKGKMQGWIYPKKSTLQAKNFIDLTGFQGSPTNVTFVRIFPGVGTEESPVIIGTTYHKFIVEALLKEVSNKTKSSVFLYDQSNELVNHIGEYDDPILTKLESKNGSYTVHNRDLITFSTSELTGWKIVASAPLKNYMGGLALLNTLIYSFIAVVMIFSIYSAIALTNGFHRPLTQLLQGFKRIEEGDLSARVQYNRKDEFEVVADGFNQMAATQEHLIKTVYEEQIAKQEAELNYLTSQINPHFLYNTLGALYSMAKRVEPNLAKAIISMSRFFRYSLTDGQDEITVDEAVKNITYYIDLLNIRNPDKYTLDVFIESEAATSIIPKLILQPIVENAVKHGIEKTSRKGVITITVTLLSKDLLISITDNGIGMSESELNRIKERLKGKSERNQKYISDGSNYALVNIYKRLQLKYGDDFQFTIASIEDIGTTVTYRIKGG